jgi:hypothetical protein
MTRLLLKNIAYYQEVMRLGRRNNAIYRPDGRLVGQSGMQYVCAVDVHIPLTHHPIGLGGAWALSLSNLDLHAKEAFHG